MMWTVEVPDRFPLPSCECEIPGKIRTCTQMPCALRYPGPDSRREGTSSEVQRRPSRVALEDALCIHLRGHRSEESPRCGAAEEADV